jgi:hypothetical protein
VCSEYRSSPVCRSSSKAVSPAVCQLLIRGYQGQPAGRGPSQCADMASAVEHEQEVLTIESHATGACLFQALQHSQGGIFYSCICHAGCILAATGCWSWSPGHCAAGHHLIFWDLIITVVQPLQEVGDLPAWPPPQCDICCRPGLPWTYACQKWR